MIAADLFIRCLENENVEFIFGVPGEENLEFLEALGKSRIRLILTRHEQAAAFMASTYGRLTGMAGVCLSTLGPGATNLVTGAAYAQLGAMPMLMITGQKPIKKSKQGQFQILNVVQMMTPIVKHTRQVHNGNTIPPIVREAFRLAEEERPGSVHIELPEDIASEATDAHLIPPHRIIRPSASPWAVSEAVRLIQNAKMPLLLLGAGANRKRISKSLSDFIDKTGLYFLNTQMGKGVIDERNPRFLGTAALSENDYIHCAIDRSDLIINVGHDVVEKPPFFMTHNGKTVIHINFLSAMVDEVYFPQLEVIGDIAESIDSMTEKCPKNPGWDFSYFLRLKSEIENHVFHVDATDSFPMIPSRVVSDVRQVMPSDGIVALDNGIYKIWFARNYRAHQPNTLLLDNALASMGAGLPSAIAAKLVHPMRKVLAVCGDGGFMMNSQELETAVRLKLDLVVLILRDNAYGMIKWKQAAMGYADFGLDFSNPDFVKYAESYRAFGHRVEKAGDFTGILTDCLNAGGVHVIDLPVDYSENQKVLIDELRAKVCIL